MLVRAAARGRCRPSAPRSWQNSSDRLASVPSCLSTALVQRFNRRHISQDSSHPNGAARASTGSATHTTHRSLSTAAQPVPVNDIPFEAVSGAFNPVPADKISDIRPFGADNTMMLDLPSAPKLQRYRVSADSIGGDFSEILPMLYACFHIGKLDRAAVIMQRIMKLNVLTASEMLKLHKEFVKSVVEQMLVGNRLGDLDVHRWFELELMRKGYLPDVELVAWMMKAALLSTTEKTANKLVQRYLGLVSSDDALDVLGMEDILTGDEVKRICAMIPEYREFLVEEGIDMEDDGLEIPITPPPMQPTEVPEVRPVKLKGMGLKTLKAALSLFNRDAAAFSGLSPDDMRAKQVQLEDDAVTSAMYRWREESEDRAKMGLDMTLRSKSVGDTMWKWQKALSEYIEQHLEHVEAAEKKKEVRRSANELHMISIAPFLRFLSVDRLAAVTILTCMTSFTSVGVSRGLPLAKAIPKLGNAVEDESLMERARQRQTKEKALQQRKQNQRNDIRTQLVKLKTEQKGQSRLATKPEDSGTVHIQGVEISEEAWPTQVKTKVGAFLMKALIESAKIPVTRRNDQTGELLTQMQPAFIHAHQYKMGRKIGVLLTNASLADMLMKEPVASLLAKHLPMIVPPEPWTKFNKGGFFIHPVNVLRIKHGDKDQKDYAQAAVGNGDMTQTIKGLDILGKTPWKINRAVFDTMLEAWNSGEEVANIAPENPTLEAPPEPAQSADPTERRLWLRELKKLENMRCGYHSQRCFQNFQLEVARALRDHTFYFPHNVDFRGRAYPIPPYLNHMGADHCRGLLMFGIGKKLGPGGLRWLKIHLANVFGYDKASLSEREAFADEHMDDIRDSVANRLHGRRWWLEAEDPWQCLATCVELVNAIDSGDPASFVSHLPVHQDGTCNGLQHYAALGGDEWGARQVNLEPGDRPADVYSAVANLVKASIQEDLEKGNAFAKILDGKITRKVVKQTVMTNVYGVTLIGARAQVLKQLNAHYPDLPNTRSLNPNILATYVTRKIFMALKDMFKGAHDIQYWLGECAGRITQCVSPQQVGRVEDFLEGRIEKTIKPKARTSRAKNLQDQGEVTAEELLRFKTSVIWTTPLRMPVVQPYRTQKSRSISTHLQVLALREPRRSDPVSKRKQLQAFPPNFIHSLDATHMLLSALECDKRGLSFAAVHDSFWTHAGDVEVMSDVLRDAFIRIHSEDIIGRLASEFQTRYSGHLHFAQVRSDSALGQKIVRWRKEAKEKYLREVGSKFKGTIAGKQKMVELLMEHRRMKLLASADPAEVAEGKAMVTPGSMFEEMSAEGDIESSEEIRGLGLDESNKADPFQGEAQVADVDEDGEILDADEMMDDMMAEEAEANDADVLVVDSEGMRRTNPTFANRIRGVSSSTVKRPSTEWAWVPWTLPPLPEKGSFNVSRTLQSKYFFS